MSTVARPVRFYPTTDMRGKWHAALQVSGQAVCGQTVVLAVNGQDCITPHVGDAWASVHPIVCRRCLRLATAQGYSERETA